MNLYVVRDARDKQGVGFFWAPDPEYLIDFVDEVWDPGYCEYCEVTTAGALAWESTADPIGIERDIEKPEGDEAYKRLAAGLTPLGSLEGFFTDDDHEWHPFFPDVATGRKVYFIGSSGHVKIGTTRGPVEYRMKSLATAHHSPLVLLAFIDHAADTLEAELHKRFAQYRVRGEWFTLSPEIQSYIDEIKGRE